MADLGSRGGPAGRTGEGTARAERPHVWKGPRASGGVKEAPSTSQACPTSGSRPAFPAIGRGWDALSLVASPSEPVQDRKTMFATPWPVPSSGSTARPASVTQPTGLASDDVRRAFRTSARVFGFLTFATSPGFSPSPPRTLVPSLPVPGWVCTPFGVARACAH